MLHNQVINELSLQWRHPVFLLLLGLAPLFGFFVGKGISAPQRELFELYHLQHLIAAFCMMALPWATALLSVVVLYRADSSRMQELIAVLPLSRARLQSLNIAGLLLSITLLGVLSGFGLLLGLLMMATTLPTLATTIELLFTLQGLQLLLGLPASALFLAVFWVLRNSRAPALVLYLTTLLLFTGYMSLANASGSPLMAGAQAPSPTLIAILGYLDWFGVTPLLESSSNPALFIINRTLTLGIAALLFACAVYLTHRQPPEPKRKEQPQPATANATAGEVTFNASQPRAFRQSMALTRLLFTQLLKHPGTLFVGMIWMVIIAAETYPALHQAEAGATLTGLSLDAINRFMWDLVPLFGSGMLLYVSYSLSWRDHQLNVATITGTLPVSESTRLLARMTLLLGLLCIFLLLTCITSIACQLVGSSPINLYDYGRFMLFSGLPLAAQGLVFLAMQSLLRRRLLAITLCITILVLRFSPLPSLLGLEHPLFSPFDTPLQKADSLLGFTPYLQGFWAFTLFWLLTAALALMLAIANPAGRTVKSLIQPRYGLPVLMLLLLSLFQLNLTNTQLDRDGKSLSADAQRQLLAEYEKHYQHFSHQPMPEVDSITTTIDVYPQQRRVQITGVYRLSNPHNKTIDRVLVGEHWRSPLTQLRLQQPATLTYDARLGQRVFDLASPLQPGQTVLLNFTLELEQSGYQAIPDHKMLTPEFTYVRAIPYFPAIGYQPIRELADQGVRKAHGLVPKPNLTTEEKLQQRQPEQDRYQWAQMHTRISTPPGYLSFSQGQLVREWQKQGRYYRQFETREPVRNIQGFVAMPGDIASRHVQGVQLQVAYQPKHRANVAMTLDAMADTVKFLSSYLGPFQGKTLTLVEKPDAGSTGYALPQLMLIGSRVGFRAIQDNQHAYSQAYRRAVHETSHQWFGHLLGNGIQQDSAFLIESMAKYVELVMLEKHQGKAAMLALVDYERRRYQHAQAHNRSEMRSLVSAQSPHDRYSRATLVFARLRAELGDGPILAALTQLVQSHRYPKPPASSLDFVTALVKQAPLQQELIETLLIHPAPITYWLEKLSKTQMTEIQ